MATSMAVAGKPLMILKRVPSTLLMICGTCDEVEPAPEAPSTTSRFMASCKVRTPLLPGDDGGDRDRGIAEPVEFLGFELHLRRRHDMRHRHGLADRADHRPSRSATL